MMKSLRLIVTTLLLAVLGVAYGQTVVFSETFNLTNGTGGNDKHWSGGIANSGYKTDNSGWELTKAYGAKQCIKLGSGKAAGKAVTPEVNLNGNGTLTFRAGAWNNGGEHTNVKLSISNGSLDQSEINLTKGAFGEYTVEITGATAPVKITFESKFKSNNRFFLDDVKVTSESTSAKTATTLTFGKPEGYTFTVDDGEQLFTNTATLTPTVAGAVITYSIDNEDIAIIDEKTGEVITTGQAGTATVMATYKGDNSYVGSTATYTITVTDPNVKGGINNPYTPSEALVAFNAGTLTKECYVRGIISKIDEVSTTFGNATYYISDDGTTSQEQLFVFRGKWIGGENFTAANQIAVGGTVLVKGNITKYNGTIEFATNNEVVEYVAPIVVTIGQSGYASLYYANQALVVPEGVEAYTYTIKNNKLEKSWMYSAGETIPAGSAVILQGAAQDYVFKVSGVTGDVDPDNVLMGTDTDTPLEADANSYFYMLSLNKDSDPTSAGFYWANSDGSTFTNHAHRAYLKVAKSAGAKRFYLFDETTAIQSVLVAQPETDAPMYNIAGQRVDKNYKGVVVQKGKKYVIK